MRQYFIAIISYCLRIIALSLCAIGDSKLYFSSPYINALRCPSCVGMPTSMPFSSQSRIQLILVYYGYTTLYQNQEYQSYHDQIYIKNRICQHQNLRYKESIIFPFSMMENLYPLLCKPLNNQTILCLGHCTFMFITLHQHLHKISRHNSIPYITKYTCSSYSPF